MGLIYLITNLVNGMVYVGKTTRPLWERWCQHKSRARHVHRNHFLYNAMRKYGIENFEIKALQADIPLEILDEREQDWIVLLSSSNSEIGYNCTTGGDGAIHGPSSKCRQKGWRTLSVETRAKISKIHTGRKYDADRIEQMRQASSGKKHSRQTIEKRAASLRTAFADPEIKARLSAIAKQRCADGNRFWEKQTPEDRKRAEESRKIWRASEAGQLHFRQHGEKMRRAAEIRRQTTAISQKGG